MNNKFASRRAELGIVAVLIAGGGVILNFGFHKRQEKRYDRLCRSNLKELHFALMQYGQDYDEKESSATEWTDKLRPYIRYAAAIDCPKVGQGGYALNRHMSRVNWSKIANPNNPETTPTNPSPPEFELDSSWLHDPWIFDSDLNGPNANDFGQSWPSAPRHPDGNNVLFTDDHVERLTIKPPFQKLRSLVP